MQFVKRLHLILNKIPKWGLTALCAAAICWLTLAPHPLGDTEIPLFPGADKICHSIMFGGLTWCILLDWQRWNWKIPCKTEYITAIAASALFGIATEWLQGTTRMGRSYDSLDFYADAMGALFFGLIYIPIAKWLGKAD